MTYQVTIPAVMKAESRWSVWQKQADGRKIPFRVLESGYWSRTKRCRSNAPEAWVTFDAALACLQRSQGHLHGLAFALGDDWMGFDFDDVVVDGEIHPQVVSWLARLGGYQEPSQSGKGIKVILRGELSDAFLGTAATGRQFKNIPSEGMATEVYDKRRFFFLTGVGCGEPKANQNAINGVCVELLAKWTLLHPKRNSQRPRIHQTPAEQLSDAVILQKIRASRQAVKFDLLWNGQIGHYDSPSEADMALTAILMWWCNNEAEQVERLFEQSALAKREKWDRADYRERTLAKAIRTDGYIPRKASRRQTASLEALRGGVQ